jgi:FMN reductase
MSRTVIINGTNHEASRINAVERYIEQKLSGVSVIDVYKLPAQALLTADFTNHEVNAANVKVAEADNVVVLTPVYKAAYTGILKTYLDLIPQKGLQGKTVLPIAVGGSPNHLLMIDYALKPVLAALGATNILQGVYIVDQAIERTDEGFIIRDDVRARLDEQLKALPVHV